MRHLKIEHSGPYKILLLALLQFISNANAGVSDFIRDYFVHKAVRNVVGFSCGDLTSGCEVNRITRSSRK